MEITFLNFKYIKYAREVLFLLIGVLANKFAYFISDIIDAIANNIREYFPSIELFIL